MMGNLFTNRRSFIKTSLGLLFLIVIGGTVTFAQSAKKPGYGILIDNTGSLRPQFSREIEIAKEIVNRVDGGASISVFLFAPLTGKEVAVATVGIECSSEKTAILRRIEGINVEGGQTLLYGSISMIGTRLGSERPPTCPEYSEKRLILITDGEDRVSRIKANELATELKKSGTVIYAVGLIDDLSSDGGFGGQSAKSKAKEFLTNITKETGGKVIFPKKKQSASEIVTELLGIVPKESN